VEAGEVKNVNRAGRRKILVSINYTCRYVLSISIELEDTCLTLSDLQGENRTCARIKTNPQADPEEFLSKVALEGLSLIHAANIPHEMILGVGVSIPGLVDREKGVSRSAYRIWENPVDVRGLLCKYLHFPILLDNNVNAFAKAELLFGGSREKENILFMKWGPGVGSAIVLHNKLYESRFSKEGELGHVTIQKNGKLCRCGRRGCLETSANIHAIANQISEACTAEDMPVLYDLVGGDVTLIRGRNIDWWFHAQDEGFWRVMDPIVDNVARTLSNTITILAPDALVYYGPVFQLPGMQERFQAHCAQFDPNYNSNYITLSTLSDKTDFIGPLAVVVTELFFSPAGILGQN
jgi:predicted NBD/HSP70 family sugar kinase